MNRIQLACWCLTASAFVLGGLVMTRVQAPLTPTAYADLVVDRQGFSMLTTRTREDEQALFVLDSFNEKLLIYRLDVTKKRLELATTADLGRLMGTGGQGGDGRRSR